MSCSSPKGHSSSGEWSDHDTGDPEASVEPVELLASIRALEAEKIRLQALVCHLLCENEVLRTRQNVIASPGPHNQLFAV
jgi:hypothetical protein